MAKELLKKLRDIRKSPETGLEGFVADSILDSVKEYGDDDDAVKSRIGEILEHGCVSGTVGELIYYKDTHKFYDKYYDDIENIVNELESQMGERIMPKIGEDRKNFYAWLGFEEQTRMIADKLELEL